MRWTPHELGIHSIDIQYGRSVVVGSPFTCKVFDLSKVIILRDQQPDLLDDADDDSGDIVFYGTCRVASARSCCDRSRRLVS